MNRFMKVLVVCASLFTFAGMAPVAMAQTTTQKCEVRKVCVPVEILGMEWEICVNVKICEDTTGQVMDSI